MTDRDDALTAAEAELLDKADAVVSALVADGLELADARAVFMQQAMAAVDEQVDESARERGAGKQERDRVLGDALKVLAKVWGDDE